MVNMNTIINTVGTNTYETIKQDIIAGRLQPGTKLKLDGLKAQYSASVSTLRETLNRLSSDGFVLSAEQRGFFVAPVSIADLTEIAQMRILLEGHALNASFASGGPEWEGDVVAAYHKLKLMEERMQSGDDSEIETWKAYDLGFHRALISACDSNTLKQLHSTIYDKYLRYQMLVLDFRGKPACNEHKNMLDMALSRNTEKALNVLETHVLLGVEHCIASFK